MTDPSDTANDAALYGLPQVMPAFSQINGVTAAIIGLTLHFSAYMAESRRC